MSDEHIEQMAEEIVPDAREYKTQDDRRNAMHAEVQPDLVVYPPSGQRDPQQPIDLTKNDPTAVPDGQEMTYTPPQEEQPHPVFGPHPGEAEARALEEKEAARKAYCEQFGIYYAPPEERE
jgi:hypothetical protein